MRRSLLHFRSLLSQIVWSILLHFRIYFVMVIATKYNVTVWSDIEWFCISNTFQTLGCLRVGMIKAIRCKLINKFQCITGRSVRSNAFKYTIRGPPLKFQYQIFKYFNLLFIGVTFGQFNEVRKLTRKVLNKSLPYNNVNGPTEGNTCNNEW